jgi:hypothetical protein
MAMIIKDMDFLNESVGEDLVYIHSNGLVQDKKSFMESIENETIDYEAIDIKEQKIRMYENTAVITGTIHVKGLLNGSAFDIDLLHTNIYIKQGSWQLVSWQSLKIVNSK